MLFLEVATSDASEFSNVLECAASRSARSACCAATAPAVPNAIAGLLLHIRDRTGKVPHAYFGWTEGNPIAYLLKFLAFGEGDIGAGQPRGAAADRARSRTAPAHPPWLTPPRRLRRRSRRRRGRDVHRGSAAMPPWSVGELPAPPVWTGARTGPAMIGPGLTLAGASVAGGEWLLGPRVGAQYGGALLWIAIASLACQYVYNVEASRYTLYTGESVLTGAFRVRPGPRVWFWLYLLMDLGALLPYQVASVATPVAAIFLGADAEPGRSPAKCSCCGCLTYAMLTLALLPLVFGGKVYNALKVLMTTKIVFVFGFLLFLAIFYSSWATWADILSGLFKVGTVPAAGGGTTNALVALWHGHWPAVDREALTTFTAFAAIAGVGGLQQASISNYTREQGWGMGSQVGRDPEPDRRPQDLAVARGHGVPRHRRGAEPVARLAAARAPRSAGDVVPGRGHRPGAADHALDRVPAARHRRPIPGSSPG